MKVVIAGGTGFLGSHLAGVLAASGHEIAVLTRGAAARALRDARYVAWRPGDDTDDWTERLGPVDAVVNLAGESIASGRWTTRRKARIRESRLAATRALISAISRMTPAPSVLLSGSAVGYYGSRGGEILTEESKPGDDFLARVCVDWEAEAMRAAPATRVALLRTGVVLDGRGGALPQMMLPFRVFGGGPVGSGEQFMSWIHRDDWVELARWAIEGTVAGPINAAAPTPVTNRVFSAALGRALNRPSWLPAPAFALRLALGEMAEALLLSSQRVLPARAESLGFQFRFREIEPALRTAVGA